MSCTEVQLDQASACRPRVLSKRIRNAIPFKDTCGSKDLTYRQSQKHSGWTDVQSRTYVHGTLQTHTT